MSKKNGTDDAANVQGEPGVEGGEDNVTPLHEDGHAQGERTQEEAPDRMGAAAEADPRTYEELFDENTDLKDRVLRSLAELENLRRRSQREKEDAAKYAISAFARDLLEVQDNLTRGLASLTPEDRISGGQALATLFDGVEMTQRGLNASFERHKVQILNPTGEKFDPNFHQAVAEIPGTDKPHGTVVDVMQTGYLIGDRLLRPAMVTIAKGSPVGGETPGGSVDTKA